VCVSVVLCAARLFVSVTVRLCLCARACVSERVFSEYVCVRVLSMCMCVCVCVCACLRVCALSTRTDFTNMSLRNKILVTLGQTA